MSCQETRLTFLDLQGLNHLSSVRAGGQTQGGLILLGSRSQYAAYLGAFIPADQFSKVTNIAAKASGDVPLPLQSFSNGKAAFNARPATVTYRYATDNTENPTRFSLMDVTLTPTNTITVTASDRGRVMLKGSTDPLSGPVSVDAGSVTFVVLADAGCEIGSLKVDGVPVSVPAGAARYEQTFPGVTADHRLETSFKARSASADIPVAAPWHRLHYLALRKPAPARDRSAPVMIS